MIKEEIPKVVEKTDAVPTRLEINNLKDGQLVEHDLGSGFHVAYKVKLLPYGLSQQFGKFLYVEKPFERPSATYFAIEELTINGKSLDLLQSPIILNQSFADAQVTTSSHKVLSGDHAREILLPFLPNSLIRLAILFHEMGHVKTLGTTIEEFPERVEDEELALILIEISKSGLTPSEAYRAIVENRITIPIHKIDVLDRGVQFFISFTDWLRRAEHLANGEMVRNMRAIQDSDQLDDKKKLDKILVALSAFNSFFRYWDNEPYSHVSCKNGSYFTQTVKEEAAILSDAPQNLFKIRETRNTLGILGNGRKLADGVPFPSESEITTYALKLLASRSFSTVIQEIEQFPHFYEDIPLTTDGGTSGTKLTTKEYLNRGDILKLRDNQYFLVVKVVPSFQEEPEDYLRTVTLTNGQRKFVLLFEHNQLDISEINPNSDLEDTYLSKRRLTDDTLQQSREYLKLVLTKLYPKKLFLKKSDDTEDIY